MRLSAVQGYRVVYALLICAVAAGCGGNLPRAGGGRAKAGATKITPRKDTSFVVAPLASDGYVDYIAAINDATSTDVTVENNAAVLLVRACGLSNISEAYRAEFLERLGIEAPAESEFSPLPADWGQTQGLWSPDSGDPNPDEQVIEAIARPWSAEEFPLLARWLEASEAPLELAIEASQRPKYYEPHACGGQILQVSNLPVSQAARDACRALAARAMLRLEQEEFQAAWSDILACYRLTRHVASTPDAVCCAVCSAMERTSCCAAAVFARSLPDDGPQLKRCLADLESMPRLRSFADKLDKGERLAFLDTLTASPRAGRVALQYKDASFNDGLKLWLGDTSNVDWNEVLRQANAWYDRGVAALRLPDHAARAKALAEIERDFKTLAEVPKEETKVVQLIAGLASKADRTRGTAALLICLEYPVFRTLEKFETEATARLSLARICFALAAWRTANGVYPRQLGALVPEFLDRLPADPFSGGAFVYQQGLDDFKLYSLGPNGRDDGGFSIGPEHPEADDVSLVNQ